jgi:hypothetical protein
MNARLCQAVPQRFVVAVNVVKRLQPPAVTLIKIESEGAGQYCSELHKTPALACASEYGPKWQLFVPPDDPMILAHTYDLMLRRESFGSGSVYINPEAQICVRYCG